MTAGDATREVPRGAGISWGTCQPSCNLEFYLLPAGRQKKTYSDGDGATLAGLLDGDGVGSTQVGTPVTTTDGDDAQLGDDDGGTDGGGNLLGCLDTQTDVALGVTNDDDGLETGTLTGTGLLLDGLDLRVGDEC